MSDNPKNNEEADVNATAAPADGEKMVFQAEVNQLLPF